MKKLILIALIILNILNVCFSNDYPQPQYLDDEEDDKKGISYFPKVNGLRMHIRCIFNNKKNKKENGKDGNLFIFETGLPYFSSSYGNIIQSFTSNQTLLDDLNVYGGCFFDRYGYGWSGFPEKPILTSEMVKKLRKSINQIGKIKGRRFYYVGFSFGSIGAQTYSMTYPNDVLGLLSIDGIDVGIVNNKWPHFYDNVPMLSNYLKPSFVGYSSQKEFIKYCNENDCSYSSWINSSEPIPKKSIEMAQVIFTMKDHNTIKTAIREYIYLDDNARHLINLYNSSGTNTPYGNMPLVLITYARNQKFNESQLTFLHQSSNSIQFIGGVNTPPGKPKHFMPFYEPDLVLSSLKALISLNKIKK